LLEPAGLLREAETVGDFTTRLALMEEAKTLSLGAVWQEHCRRQNVPGDASWIAEVKSYETQVLSKRH
jgi:L-rhamnose isomerase